MALAAPPNAPLVLPPHQTPNAPPARWFTAADLERMTAEGLHYELIKGVLHEMMPPGGDHGFTTMGLSTYLNIHILNQRLGRGFSAETGFLLARDPDTVLAPDFAFVATAKLSGPTPRGYVPVVPDLVLETRSPSDTKRSAEEKVARWLGFGARVVLEMNPPRRVLRVYRPQATPLAEGETPTPDAVLGVDDTLLLPEVLPGFSLSLALVFRDEADDKTHGEAEEND